MAERAGTVGTTPAAGLAAPAATVPIPSVATPAQGATEGSEKAAGSSIPTSATITFTAGKNTKTPPVSSFSATRPRAEPAGSVEPVEAPPAAMAETPAPVQIPRLVGMQDQQPVASATMAAPAAIPLEVGCTTTARLRSPASPSISPATKLSLALGAAAVKEGMLSAGMGAPVSRPGGNGGNSTAGNGGNGTFDGVASGGGIYVDLKGNFALKPRLGAKKGSRESRATDLITSNSAVHAAVGTAGSAGGSVAAGQGGAGIPAGKNGTDNFGHAGGTCRSCQALEAGSPSSARRPRKIRRLPATPRTYSPTLTGRSRPELELGRAEMRETDDYVSFDLFRTCPDRQRNLAPFLLAEVLYQE